MPWYNLIKTYSNPMVSRYYCGLPWLVKTIAMVVKCIVSSYCKTNGNSLKNLYIEKRFINNLVNAATTHLFNLPIAVDTNITNRNGTITHKYTNYYLDGFTLYIANLFLDMPHSPL